MSYIEVRAVAANNLEKLSILSPQEVKVRVDTFRRLASGEGGDYDDTEIREEIAELKEDISALQTKVDNLPSGGAGGVSEAMVNSLWSVVKKIGFVSPLTEDEKVAFKTAWGITGEDPIIPDDPVPEKTLTSISAIYNGGDVEEGTSVADLTDIVVTAHWSDGTSNTVTGWTASGTINTGENTVTIAYEGKTATIVVNGTAIVPDVPAYETVEMSLSSSLSGAYKKLGINTSGVTPYDDEGITNASPKRTPGSEIHYSEEFSERKTVRISIGDYTGSGIFDYFWAFAWKPSEHVGYNLVEMGSNSWNFSPSEATISIPSGYRVAVWKYNSSANGTYKVKVEVVG